MSPFESRAPKTTKVAAERQKHNQGLAQKLRDNIESVREGGSAESRKKHEKRGKLLVRQRIGHLIDKGSNFLEVGALAGHQMYHTPIPSAGLVTGIGWIHGRPTMIIANDATVKGGTYFPITVKKHLRALEIAQKCHLDCVYLVDSGGAYLPLQDEVFPDRDHFGRIFYQQAQLSAQGCAQVAVVMGSCTAGGAYVPAMADMSIIVENQGTIFLGGPPLVKAATGETVTAEALGGSKVHGYTSGLADAVAKDDLDALEITRSWLKPRRNPHTFIPLPHDMPGIKEPKQKPEDIYRYIPQTLREPMDLKEILARIVDGSEWTPFKPTYGTTLFCGWAKIWGLDIGIIANEGILFGESAQKGTHFIQLCQKRGIPLLFLQNITGFMVGKRVEAQGIAKEGAKMVNAVACATVPKVTLIIGGSYGAGNYAMCGRAYSPDFLWTWPNSRIGVMGGAQAADVLKEVQKSSEVKAIKAQFDKQSDPYYATARLWDDGIIDPAMTRKVLGLSFHITVQGQSEKQKVEGQLLQAQYGTFRM